MNHIKYTCDDNKAWCGAYLDNSFYFKDAEAATINAKMKGETKACIECIKKIMEYLNDVL